MANRSTSLLLGALGLSVATGCAMSYETGDVECDDGKCDEASDQALCSVTVSGYGSLDLEENYLPRVIACENYDSPAASLEALAIAARSYAYYVVRVERRSLQPSVRDQHYNCGKPPVDRHYAAVRETQGLVLQYNEAQVAGFFDTGAHQSPPTCKGGTDNPRSERYITYNDGATGSDVEPSPLGGVNDHNRGALSHYGSNCLADIGLSADEILRFYYGADIDIVPMHGTCVGSDSVGTPCAGDEGGTCVDVDSMECAGELETGLCPGPSNIVCCIP